MYISSIYKRILYDIFVKNNCIALIYNSLYNVIFLKFKILINFKNFVTIYYFVYSRNKSLKLFINESYFLQY